MNRRLLGSAAFFLAAGMAVSAAATGTGISNPDEIRPSEREMVDAVSRAQQATVAILRIPRMGNDPVYNHPDRIKAAIRATGVHIRNGYVVTALHAAIDNDSEEKSVLPEITILAGGHQELSANLVGISEYFDMAVYRIDKNLLKTPLADMPLAGRDLAAGEEIFTVGYPLDWGRVTTYGRVGETETYIATAEARLMQADLRACSGNSGGGIFNAKGELAGVMHGIMPTEPRCSSISYAVPGRMMGTIVDSMIRGRNIRLSHMGVAMEEMVRLQDAWHVAVTGVSGPAQEAGIRKGDLLLSIDGIPVVTTRQARAHIVEHTVPGQKSQVKVLRQGQEMNFTVTMGGTAP